MKQKELKENHNYLRKQKWPISLDSDLKCKDIGPTGD